jgi:hypothetical protein
VGRKEEERGGKDMQKFGKKIDEALTSIISIHKLLPSDSTYHIIILAYTTFAEKESCSVSNVVVEDFIGFDKWWGSVLGTDDCIYSIPYFAVRVVRFDPKDKSLTEIGPDLGDDDVEKWETGVLAGNGCIYCLPFFYCRHFGILKIDTINGSVETLHVELPEGEGDAIASWAPSALAIDGCIYFMPSEARRILKLNPE